MLGQSPIRLVSSKEKSANRLVGVEGPPLEIFGLWTPGVGVTVHRLIVKRSIEEARERSYGRLDHGQSATRAQHSRRFTEKPEGLLEMVQGIEHYKAIETGVAEG